MEFSDIFRIVNLVVAAITVLGGIAHLFGWSFSQIIVSVYMIIFGLGIALLGTPRYEGVTLELLINNPQSSRFLPRPRDTRLSSSPSSAVVFSISSSAALSSARTSSARSLVALLASLVLPLSLLSSFLPSSPLATCEKPMAVGVPSRFKQQTYRCRISTTTKHRVHTL